MPYVDLQVNGAFGVDFNDDSLTLEQFELACDRLHETGVEGFLPTIITDSIETMCQRIQKIAGMLEFRPSLKQIVRGIHVEGPFISNQQGFYGTHPSAHIVPANQSDVMRLLDAGKGSVRLLTLAPEQDPECKVIRLLCDQKVLVFAGHTDASYEEMLRAIDHGLVGFTHLGNGCKQQVDRQDNIMQRILALRGLLYVSMIADGIHLPGWLLQSWLNIIGTERSVIVSDSINAAGMPPGEYTIGNQKILVDSSRRTRHRDHGYLAGSASTMKDMDQFLANSLSINHADRNRILFANALDLLQS